MHRAVANNRANKVSPKLKRFLKNFTCHYSGQLDCETEEHKERILKKALKHLVTRIPKAILDLKKLNEDLAQFYDSYYANDVAFEEMNEQIHQLYKATRPSYLKKGLREMSKLTTVQNGDLEVSLRTDNKLLQACTRHWTKDGSNIKLDPNHVCSTNHSQFNSISLYPWGLVPANKEMINLSSKVREMVIHLTEHFYDIGLGISLMYPRTEDNEDSNISILVLNHMSQLTVIDNAGKFHN